MIKSGLFGGDISMLGFGLMRLPRQADDPSRIDRKAASALVDHAMRNGVNYYDTAYTYGDSEDFVGSSLSGYPRDSYYLATKCPPWMVGGADDFERIFGEQCRRCKTDYFDFYLVHNLAQEAKRAAGNVEFFDRFEKIGFYDMLVRKKTEGKIRRLGFSFHGTIDLMQKLVEKYEWDFAMIQLNYLDWTATDAKRQYELLTGHGIPVVIMEPLRGGALAELSDEAADMLYRAGPGKSVASWAIRYAASFPNVVTVLSGMSSMEQLVDNLATLEDFQPVCDAEKQLLSEVAAVYGKSGAIACTGCGYCLPCPAEVSIPRIFSVYNNYVRRGYRIPFDNGYSTLGEHEKASACIGCGLCEEKCPQHLAIPEHLHVIDEFAKGKE